MQETERLIELYADLYQGDPWLEINIIDVLKCLSPQQAFKKISSQWNSIWEITAHLFEWRMTVLRRISGEKVETPSHNYFLPVKNNSPEAWSLLLNKLEVSQTKWVEYLRKMKVEDFDKSYSGNGMNYYKHIHGIIQHDAYHLGQIVMLSKHINLE